MKNIINVNDIEWQESPHENFSHFRKSLSNNSAGKMIGTSLYKLLPGNKAFPFHTNLPTDFRGYIVSEASHQQITLIACSDRKLLTEQ